MSFNADRTGRPLIVTGLVNIGMSDVIQRRPDGTVLPGQVLNRTGRPLIDKPQFNRFELQRVCVEEDYEPIRALIRLSRHPDASPYLQFAVHKEIAEYLYPKRKSVVIGDENGEQSTIHISWDNPPDDQQFPRKRTAKEARQFTHAMNTAGNRIMDAVLSDDDEDAK